MAKDVKRALMIARDQRALLRRVANIYPGPGGGMDPGPGGGGYAGPAAASTSARRGWLSAAALTRMTTSGGMALAVATCAAAKVACISARAQPPKRR